ncbi:MAG: hypothetical protein JXA94_07235 [Parachlamydiales bacterium]|nr:hypothetical protein [Parachlamydiales bacterium]
MNEKTQLDKKINEIEKIKIKLDDFSSNEEKINFLLDEMRNALNDETQVDFNYFWGLKNLCLTIFKLPINSISRVEFWKRFIDISNQSKKIKEIFDDNISFEIEQIELTIDSLEKDLNNFSQIAESVKDLELNNSLQALFSKKEYFLNIHKELSVLNSFSIRINSLRKEIIKTNMRLSLKNRLLKRLSAVGDFVFPKRKELIKDLSQEFLNCIDSYIENFDLKNSKYFILKDEIKSLQSIAKVLTLNTHSFTTSRLKLSDCWDKVKVAEKEYKQDRLKSLEVVNKVTDKIDALHAMCKNDPEDKNIEKTEDEIVNFMKTLELTSADVKFLKNKIKNAKAPIFEKKQHEKIERINVQKQEEESRVQKIEDIKNHLKDLISKKEISLEELENEKIDLDEKMKSLNLLKFEKLIMDKDFKVLKDLIEEKKEIKLFENESDELKSFKLLLEQKRLKKQTLKQNLDNLKKELSGSGFDFEKAMIYRELIDSEKLRFDELDASINELEDKIDELESV